MIISVSQGREIAALFSTNEAVMLSKQHGASRSLFLRQKLIVSDAFRCRADRERTDGRTQIETVRRSRPALALIPATAAPTAVSEGGRESNGNLVDSTASVGDNGERTDGRRERRLRRSVGGLARAAVAERASGGDGERE